MLIGYSVDTDILLTSRLLKRKNEDLYSRLVSAMKTGVMMVVTTLSAVIVALLITNSSFIREVMIIVLIGLIVDLIFTWFQNAPVLIYYLERKK
jgi:preprotein translocase subunit SecF